MKQTARELVILIADDNFGHVRLLVNNLRRAGVSNEIIRFEDGDELLDFLYGRSLETRLENTSYLLLLDIRMPRTDGIEVLKQVKEDPELRKMPVIMLTTTDDPRDIERCHSLGCCTYIVKPIEFEEFTEAITRLGVFVNLVKVAEMNRQIERS